MKFSHDSLTGRLTTEVVSVWFYAKKKAQKNQNLSVKEKYETSKMVAENEPAWFFSEGKSYNNTQLGDIQIKSSTSTSALLS